MRIDAWISLPVRPQSTLIRAFRLGKLRTGTAECPTKPEAKAGVSKGQHVLRSWIRYVCYANTHHERIAKKPLLRSARSLFLLILIASQARCADFGSAWARMQSIYAQWHKGDTSAAYTNSYWQNDRQKIAALIQGPPNSDYLYHQTIQQNMVRGGYTLAQLYEETYLAHCISQSTKQLLAPFKDHDLYRHESHQFSCSTNSLGHLFYAAKVIEAHNGPLNTIIEFGSGFGNLARIFKQLYPAATIVLIDLPELLAIQYLFLQTTMPHVDVVAHHEALKPFDTAKIHLVPIWLLPQITGNPDLFISTFALSEAPAHVQDAVIEKKFFNARMCYITGQINGWQQLGHQWIEQHQTITQAVRRHYQQVQCQPFHIYAHEHQSYEVIAKREVI